MFIRKQYLIRIGASSSPFPVEITPDSSFVVQPLSLSVSPYFEDDNENTDGIVPGLSLCADVRWRTSLLHTSSRTGLESFVWLLIPALPRRQLILTPKGSEKNLSKHIKQLRCCVRPPAVFNASPAKEEEKAHFKAFVTFPIQKLSWNSGALGVLWGRGSEIEGFGLFYYYKTRIEQNLVCFSSSIMSCQCTPDEQRSWRSFKTRPSINFP